MIRLFRYLKPYIASIILVIALLTLPAVTANFFSRSLWQMMIGATLVGMLCTTSGLAISYKPDLPAGAVIILVAGAAYLVAAVGNYLIITWRNRRLQRP